MQVGAGPAKTDLCQNPERPRLNEAVCQDWASSLQISMRTQCRCLSKEAEGSLGGTPFILQAHTMRRIHSEQLRHARSEEKEQMCSKHKCHS